MQSRSIHAETIRAAGAILANRCVKFDGTQAAAQGEKVLGVAQHAAALNELVAVDVMGTAIIEAGAPIAKGDSLIVDAAGRAIPASALAVAAGGVAVTSTAANGAILVGGDLPEFVIGDALGAAAGAGEKIEVVLRR